MERSSKAHYKHHRQCWNLLYVNSERWASLSHQLIFLFFLIETNQFKRDIRDIQPQSFYHKKLSHSLLVSILHESVLGAQCWLRSRWWEVVSIREVGSNPCPGQWFLHTMFSEKNNVRQLDSIPLCN